MNWYDKKHPGDPILAKPWLHPDVVEYLQSLLKPKFNILEHGSGGSTLWFAERVHSVTAIESDRGWYWAIQNRLPYNAKVLLCDPEEFPVISASYDLMLIDGEPIQERAKWIQASRNYVKPGGFVVIDNANRPEYEDILHEFAKKAHLLHRFDCNSGDTSYLVTDFYQLPGE